MPSPDFSLLRPWKTTGSVKFMWNEACRYLDAGTIPARGASGLSEI
jgi:hypothetical protein